MLLTTNVLQNISRLCLPCADQDHQINLKSKHSRKCCQSSIILDIAQGKKKQFWCSPVLLGNAYLHFIVCLRIFWCQHTSFRAWFKSCWKWVGIFTLTSMDFGPQLGLFQCKATEKLKAVWFFQRCYFDVIKYGGKDPKTFLVLDYSHFPDLL